MSKSRILKIIKFMDPDFKILQQEWSQSLEMWLRPPLVKSQLQLNTKA